MNQKPSPLHRASEWIVDHYRLFFVVFAALLVFSAVASGWVKVENDVAAYLPADSETRQGLDIMEQEFQTYGSAKILLRDTDADAAAATAEQIRAVDGVDSCTYTMNDTGSALLSVSLSDLEGSDTCAQTVQALRDLLDGSGAYIYSAEGYSISDQINGEVRGLLVIVAIILITVLTFTSSTYAEVPILLITFLAAALINKGTNFVFGTISFVSNAVAILLQLAMSVDYAIIFCNRYKQAHETLPVREAVSHRVAGKIHYRHQLLEPDDHCGPRRHDVHEVRPRARPRHRAHQGDLDQHADGVPAHAGAAAQARPGHG